jgi:hypothetical protein
MERRHVGLDDGLLVDVGDVQPIAGVVDEDWCARALHDADAAGAVLESNPPFSNSTNSPSG